VKRQVSYAMAAGLMAAAGSASALPSVFNDSVPDGITTFDSTVTSAGGTVNTDNLTGLSSGNTWTRTDYTITSTDGSSRSIDPSYSGLTGQSIGINPYSPPANSGLTFTFNSPINAFALEIGDWATCCYLPSSLYISFDGGATKLVASAYSAADNPGVVKEGEYANLVGAVDDSATFQTISFYGDGYGEYLVAGGTIRYAVVPIGSFTGPGVNYQPLITNSISSMQQQAMNIFQRLTGRLHGLDNQYRKNKGAALQQTPTEALALAAEAAAGQSGTGEYLSEAASSMLAQQDLAGASYANGDGSGWQDAMDFFKIGGVRGFVKARYHVGDRDPVGSQDGFNFKGYTLTAGVDKNVRRDLIVGLAMGYSQHDSEADTTHFDIKSKSWIFSLFSSWAPNPNVYVDTVLSYGNSTHTATRSPGTGEGSPTGGDSIGEPESTEYLAAVSIGKLFGYKAFNYGPFAGVQYARSNVDGYTEYGGAAPQTVGSQSAVSLTAHAGMQGAWTLDKPNFTLVPQIRVAVEREFKNNDHTIYVGPVGGTQTAFNVIGDGADTYGRLNVGLSFNSKDKPRSFRLDYEGMYGRDKLAAHAVTARLRWAFD